MTDAAATHTPSSTEIPVSPVSAEPAAVPAPAVSARPEGLPDKFWDPAKGEVRADALATSYLQLEQKLGGLDAAGIPADPAGYDIELSDGMPTPDAEVNARLHEAGFSQTQAQLVYELAGEYLMLMVSEMAAEFASQSEQEALSRHFGGEDR